MCGNRENLKKILHFHHVKKSEDTKWLHKVCIFFGSCHSNRQFFSQHSSPLLGWPLLSCNARYIIRFSISIYFWSDPIACETSSWWLSWKTQSKIDCSWILSASKTVFWWCSMCVHIIWIKNYLYSISLCKQSIKIRYYRRMKWS